MKDHIMTQHEPKDPEKIGTPGLFFTVCCVIFRTFVVENMIRTKKVFFLTSIKFTPFPAGPNTPSIPPGSHTRWCYRAALLDTL